MSNRLAHTSGASCALADGCPGAFAAPRGSQNKLNQALLASALLLVVLGGVYTFASERGSRRGVVLEVVLLVLMAGTIVLALLYLAYVGHRDGWNGAQLRALQNALRSESPKPKMPQVARQPARLEHRPY